MHLAGDRLCIRVEQQLVRVEALALLGLVGAVDAVAVELAGFQSRHVAVPDEVGALAQLQPRDFAPAGLVEEAELDALGMAREEREVDALVVPGGAERIGGARPELEHGVHHGLGCHVFTRSRRPRSGISIHSGRCAIS